ncbi:Ankyrin repeat-containing protein [Morus notabilis]|uniref:Ankyrin repeat-containing protein n=1 Tax=Morus notabilis TaxID=981085 RepID=W9QY79_9ROSA|nr:Ankyrin repeat-containing protein [Morus notabilis]
MAGSDQEITNFRQHRLLFDAVRHGNWETAKTYLHQHPDAVRARINISGKTPLHVAVSDGHLHIVEELVQLMTEEDLLTRRKDGFTVLAAAIEIGNISITKCLIRKNKKLLSIERRSSEIPVIIAVRLNFHEMARYLYTETPEEDLKLRDNGKTGSFLISECIYRNHFDIPIHLLERSPGLAIILDSLNRSPVWALGRTITKSVFAGRSQLGFWQRWIYDLVTGINTASHAANQISIDVQNRENSQMDENDFTPIKAALVGLLARIPSKLLQLLDVKHIHKTKLAHVQYLELLSIMYKAIETTSDENQINKARVHDAIKEAVSNGNVEFIKKISRANPELVWTSDLARDVFVLAIELRQAEVLSLMHGLPNKQVIAISYFPGTENTMLHKAASIPSSKILNLIPGGAALQMQRELQWFKEQSASTELFTANHKDLVIAGEKWMKDTSGSCTVVGALIVTITFAAAFTVPGGNDQNIGFPIFRNKKLFKVFFISDAISLFASTTSVLMFLGILTSRYAEEDFLKSLPTKMIIGLSTLFL